jgi:hypothetical protein
LVAIALKDLFMRTILRDLVALELSMCWHVTDLDGLTLLRGLSRGRGLVAGAAPAGRKKPQRGDAGAESMSRDAANAGALAFKRSGDPNIGSFADATILKSFGEVPENLDEL